MQVCLLPIHGSAPFDWAIFKAANGGGNGPPYLAGANRLLIEAGVSVACMIV